MPRLRAPSSTTSSSLIPPSYCDDGRDIPSRLPAPLPPPQERPFNLQRWLDGDSQSSVTAVSQASASTYTGSYVDDGADMFLPYTNAPLLGRVNSQFYRRGQRTDPEDEVPWSEEVQRAVSGDLRRTVEELGRRANLKIVDEVEEQEERSSVKDRRQVHWTKGEEDSGMGEDPDAVKIVVPKAFGTFVIPAEDGRVVVVDKDGEFDSGVPGEVVDWANVREQKKEERRAMAEEKAKWQEMKKYKENMKHRRPESYPAKPLSTIVEDIISDGEVFISSPTKLFMPDDYHGLPSPHGSHVGPPSAPASHIFSPPSAWPSPLLSPTRPAVDSPNQAFNSWTQNKDAEQGVPASPVKQFSAVGSANRWNQHGEEGDADKKWGQPFSPEKPASSLGSEGIWDPEKKAASWDKPTSVASSRQSRQIKSSVSSAAVPDHCLENVTDIVVAESPIRHLSSKQSSRHSRKAQSSTGSAAVPDPWIESQTWNQDASVAELPIGKTSLMSSSRPSRKSSSAAVPASWNEPGTWDADSKVKTISSSSGPTSDISLKARSNEDGSLLRDVETFNSRVPHRNSSIKAASVGSLGTSWGGGKDRHHINSPRGSVRSQGSSTTSKISWGENIENKSARSSWGSGQFRPLSTYNVGTSRGGTEAEKHSSDSSRTTAIRHAPSIPASSVRPSWGLPMDTRSSQSNDSRKSTIEPYSWHRNMDEESTYSNVGSSPRILSDAGSKLFFVDDDGEDRDDNKSTGNRSSVSHYRAPFIEDIPETPAEEKTSWDFNTPSVAPKSGSTNITKRSSDDAGGTATQAQESWSPRGSNRSTRTSWGDSPRSHRSHGSRSGGNGRQSERGAEIVAEREWKGEGEGQDRSGFDEDNKTWLNAETPGGVRYRKSEWEWSTPGTVRDV